MFVGGSSEESNPGLEDPIKSDEEVALDSDGDTVEEGRKTPTPGTSQNNYRVKYKHATLTPPDLSSSQLLSNQTISPLPVPPQSLSSLSLPRSSHIDDSITFQQPPSPTPIISESPTLARRPTLVEQHTSSTLASSDEPLISRPAEIRRNLTVSTSATDESIGTEGGEADGEDEDYFGGNDVRRKDDEWRQSEGTRSIEGIVGRWENPSRGYFSDEGEEDGQETYDPQLRRLRGPVGNVRSIGNEWSQSPNSHSNNGFGNEEFYSLKEFQRRLEEGSTISDDHSEHSESKSANASNATSRVPYVYGQPLTTIEQEPTDLEETEAEFDEETEVEEVEPRFHSRGFYGQVENGPIRPRENSHPVGFSRGVFDDLGQKNKGLVRRQ
jgi:hypothetical protein